MLKNIMGVALVAVAAVGCGSTTDAPTALAACVGNVITVDDGAPVGCDVIPPQRLDVRMGDAPDIAHRCADMGGSLDGPVCIGVDY